MTTNVEDIKFSIDALAYPIAFKDIVEKKEYSNLKSELEYISQVVVSKWTDTRQFTSNDSFPLYLTGFKPSEIAKIRGISRQSESNKVTTEIDKLLLEGLIEDVSEVENDHLRNRKNIQNIVIKYFVIECGLQKDISLMDNILGSKHRTNRSKYVAYLKLGGDESIFTIDNLDKRYVSPDEDETLRKAYNMFEQGKTNREVADVLGLKVAKIYYFRKKYYKINNPKDVL